MGPAPFYGARAEKPPKKADFAMKQTNICRLSGDINYSTVLQPARKPVIALKLGLRLGVSVSCHCGYGLTQRR